MSSIKIGTSGNSLSVESPYNTRFVAAARKLGGRWVAPEWQFDLRDEQRVRDLCRELYGDDGLGARDLVTLRVCYPDGRSKLCEPITLGGRPIARAWGRDSGAKIGDGVVILSGGFGSGGSVKNWCTRAEAGTVVLVRDVPRTLAERLSAETPDRFSIEPEAPVIDRAALTAERDRLAARIAEIDKLLEEAK